MQMFRFRLRASEIVMARRSTLTLMDLKEQLATQLPHIVQREGSYSIFQGRSLTPHPVSLLLPSLYLQVIVNDDDFAFIRINILRLVTIRHDFIEAADLRRNGHHVFRASDNDGTQLLGITTGNHLHVRQDTDDGIRAIDLEVRQALADGNQHILIRTLCNLLKRQRRDDVLVIRQWPLEFMMDIMKGIEEALRIDSNPI